MLTTWSLRRYPPHCMAHLTETQVRAGGAEGKKGDRCDIVQSLQPPLPLYCLARPPHSFCHAAQPNTSFRQYPDARHSRGPLYFVVAVCAPNFGACFPMHYCNRQGGSVVMTGGTEWNRTEEVIQTKHTKSPSPGLSTHHTDKRLDAQGRRITERRALRAIWATRNMRTPRRVKMGSGFWRGGGRKRPCTKHKMLS